MTNLLVAIDGSQYTSGVVRVAARMAGALGADVTVFHLLAQNPAARGPAEDSESTDRARQIVDDATGQLIAAGIARVDGRVDKGLSGDEATAILDAATKLDAELIVMGHRGTGQLAGLFLGSVAHKVIGQANRPILIVR
jgi:nucleotide-binding universal stress UspA family protein